MLVAAGAGVGAIEEAVGVGNGAAPAGVAFD